MIGKFATCLITLPEGLSVGQEIPAINLEDGLRYLDRAVFSEELGELRFFWIGRYSRDLAMYFRSVYTIDKLTEEEKATARQMWAACVSTSVESISDF